MKTPKKIMDAARGEECTLNVVAVCNHNNETSVMAHLPDGSGGSNRLTGPLSIAITCSSCHDYIDARRQIPTSPTDKEFYMRRGMMRTMTRLVEMGVLKW